MAETETWGRGTYIGDGSDVLTDPEPAGHRWLPSPPACAPSLGRPVTAIPSVGDSVKNKADNFFLDKCRMANPVKRATDRPCSEKGTTGPVKRLTNQPTNL